MAKASGLVLGILLTCAFGYYAIRDVDFTRFQKGLGESDYRWLVPALAVLAFGVWLRALRWQLLFTPATRPRLQSVTNALLIGYFFNQLLPLRAGEAARVVALNRETGTPLAQAAATAIAERLYDIAVLLLLLFVALPLLPTVPWIHRATIVALLFGALCFGLVLALLRFGARPLSFVLRPLERLRFVTPTQTQAAAVNAVRGLAALHLPGIASRALLATVASWLVLAVSFWCVLAAFHLVLGYDAALLLVVAVNLALVLPSAPAAVGTFEAAVVLALDPYGIDKADALALAVVLHALNLFPFIVAGFLALNVHAVRRRASERYNGHARQWAEP